MSKARDVITTPPNASARYEPQYRYPPAQRVELRAEPRPAPMPPRHAVDLSLDRLSQIILDEQPPVLQTRRRSYRVKTTTTTEIVHEEGGGADLGGLIEGLALLFFASLGLAGVLYYVLHAILHIG